MKTFLVHLKAGGSPLTYEALSYETVEGKIYFFKDEEKKDRSLFVVENDVSAITEENVPASPFMIRAGSNDPMLLAFQKATRPEFWRNIRNKVRFKHPLIWGLTGFLLCGITAVLEKDFLILAGFLKVFQLGFLFVATSVLLVRLLKDPIGLKTARRKLYLGLCIICLCGIAVVIIPVYSDYFSYAAVIAPIKNLSYWKPRLTQTVDGYVASAIDDSEMRAEYMQEKGPCAIQFKGGTFSTEPAELTSSERAEGYIWKAKGFFRFTGKRKLNLKTMQWYSWEEYNPTVDEGLFSISILRDGSGKWMSLYTEELAVTQVDLLKLPQ